MKLLALAIALLGLGGQSQEERDREKVAGAWKVDQKYGFALEAAKYEKPLDWIITLKKDGSYVWSIYEPFVEGVGRRHRDMKGTFVVNLYDDRLILKSTDITGRRTALVCVLGQDRKSFVIQQEENGKGLNPYQDRRIKFLKIEPKPPAETGGTTGG